MGFVVRTADKVGNVGWLSVPDPRGLRTIAARRTAEVFPDQETAKQAIGRMPALYAQLGLDYLIEMDEE